MRQKTRAWSPCWPAALATRPCFRPPRNPLALFTGLRKPGNADWTSVELSIDTSTRHAGVALTQSGELGAELAWRSNQNHTRELGPAVQMLLRQVGATARDISAVSVALGPGGFSALRVGLSFAKGIAEGLRIPLVAVGTLELEAFPLASTGLPVYAVGDAGRGQLAWAAFLQDETGWRVTAEERIATP
ncbi:MAG: tRNA (adenosine(37)-N6)-threonylcarbamoyltransferase complex dimerization subunit type 1 TsaB, partial [SAR202 cluster bacterium]|nr:tRNA (adenosine(37)-N6)-threonylcarbamoyltransferase complex dimerization subunit type 1 TsaB [SAR202 cluster bacterium]